MTSRPPTILMPPAQTDLEASLRIPPPKQNIFQRIIRNPRSDSINPKERECTEMLCSVLQNSPAVGTSVLSWLCSLVGLPADLLDKENIEVSMDTELSIGSKRDDLRIEIHRVDDSGRSLIALLSMEVKVGASIHMSGRQELPDDSEREVDAVKFETEEVSQIVNYDTWLDGEKQKSPWATIAGIVLAKGDMTAQLPGKLKVPWKCVTWTKLGKRLLDVLARPELQASDALLARHLWGFIKNNLWREEEMNDEAKLDFDDVALLRAFGTHGKGLEDRVNDLVEPLGKIIDPLCEAGDNVTHHKLLFKDQRRSVVRKNLLKRKYSPYIEAGIALHQEDVTTPAAVILWIVTPSTNPNKQAIRSLTKEKFGELRARDLHWERIEDDGWIDLSASVPLQEVLNVDEQAKFIQDHIQGLVDDLKAIGFVEELKNRMKS